MRTLKVKKTLTVEHVLNEQSYLEHDAEELTDEGLIERVKSVEEDFYPEELEAAQVVTIEVEIVPNGN